MFLLHPTRFTLPVWTTLQLTMPNFHTDWYDLSGLNYIPCNFSSRVTRNNESFSTQLQRNIEISLHVHFLPSCWLIKSNKETRLLLSFNSTTKRISRFLESNIHPFSPAFPRHFFYLFAHVCAKSIDSTGLWIFNVCDRIVANSDWSRINYLFVILDLKLSRSIQSVGLIGKFVRDE